MVEVESTFAFDGQVDVSEVIGAGQEADEAGDEKDGALDALQVGNAVYNDAA